MKREEIQKWCVDEYDILIRKYGEDHVYMKAPKPGKNSWTLKELRESVVNDTIPDGMNENDIDLMEKYLKYREEQGLSNENLEHTKL